MGEAGPVDGPEREAERPGTEVEWVGEDGAADGLEREVGLVVEGDPVREVA